MHPASNRPDADRTEPIRLALVITELEPGGAERCLVELATRLDRSRFLPVVYSLGPQPLVSKQCLIERLVSANIPAHFLDLSSPWQYFTAVRELAGYFREQRPQVVQTFLFHANVVGTRAARMAAIPRVATGIRVADPRRWRTALERIATSSASRFVCVSQSVADFCRQRGYSADKIVVITNGIDMARWRNAQPADLAAFGVPVGRRVFVYVGRLDSQKGLDRFFAELPAIFRELPEHDFLIVGDGPQKSALQAEARKTSVEKRIHFAGWQTEIPAILAAADLLVHPSRWEGMPNVLLEAMAAGKPVVATRIEGVEELLGPGSECQTVPPEDWQGLRRRVVEILRNPLLSREQGEKNLERAGTFSIDSMVSSYERLFAALAQS